jgi:hypothetical protein
MGPAWRGIALPSNDTGVWWQGGEGASGAALRTLLSLGFGRVPAHTQAAFQRS